MIIYLHCNGIVLCPIISCSTFRSQTVSTASSYVAYVFFRTKTYKKRPIFIFINLIFLHYVQTSHSGNVPGIHKSQDYILSFNSCFSHRNLNLFQKWLKYFMKQKSSVFSHIPVLFILFITIPFFI